MTFFKPPRVSAKVRRRLNGHVTKRASFRNHGTPTPVVFSFWMASRRRDREVL